MSLNRSTIVRVWFKSTKTPYSIYGSGYRCRNPWVFMEVGVAFYFAGKQVAVLDEVHWGIRPAFTIAAYVWCLCTTQSKFNWIVVLTTPMCYYNGVSSEDTFMVNYPYVGFSIIMCQCSSSSLQRILYGLFWHIFHSKIKG